MVDFIKRNRLSVVRVNGIVLDRIYKETTFFIAVLKTYFGVRVLGVVPLEVNTSQCRSGIDEGVAIREIGEIMNSDGPKVLFSKGMYPESPRVSCTIIVSEKSQRARAQTSSGVYHSNLLDLSSGSVSTPS